MAKQMKLGLATGYWSSGPPAGMEQPVAQAEDMEKALMARSPMPWVEYVQKFTYPAVTPVIKYMNHTPDAGGAPTASQEEEGSWVQNALNKVGQELGQALGSRFVSEQFHIVSDAVGREKTVRALGREQFFGDDAVERARHGDVVGCDREAQATGSRQGARVDPVEGLRHE